MASRQNALLVVAIDFGTTYSGFAIQFRHEFDPKDPTKIRSPQVWNGGKQNLMSYKTPTCLLLTEDQKIDSFGFVAEERYADLCIAKPKENHKYYYYRRFKMRLQEGQGLKKGSLLEDETQKTMPALKVFALSITCLKDSLMELLDREGTGVCMKDIIWVLTVPAIWDEAAKGFMKEAAKMADIEEDHLFIALEPEVASLYCQHLPMEKFSQGGMAGFATVNAGTTYMVADLGGGTTDIAIHERQRDNKIKEVYQATGGPWGGTAVDNAFTQMIISIIGGPAWKRFTKETSEHLELLKEFECVKRTLGTKSGDKTGQWYNIRLPAVMSKICGDVHKQTFAELTKESLFTEEITFVADKMRMTAGLVERLFRKVTNRIVQHINNILTSTDAGKKVSLILMVGGFSESPFVQQVMKSEISDKSKVKVVIPRDAGIAVLNGAVVFGRIPEAITTRVIRYTYGVCVTPEFLPGVHPEENKLPGNPPRCSHVFSPFMNEGKSVDRDHKVMQIYNTTVPNQKEMSVSVFTVSGTIPDFVTDRKCHLLGTFTATVPNPSEKERILIVIFRFGSTTLTAYAVDQESKRSCTTTFRLQE